MMSRKDVFRTHPQNIIIYNSLCKILLTGEQLIAQFHDIFNNGVSFLVPYEQSVSYDLAAILVVLIWRKKTYVLLFVVWRVKFKIKKNWSQSFGKLEFIGEVMIFYWRNSDEIGVLLSLCLHRPFQLIYQTIFKTVCHVNYSRNILLTFFCENDKRFSV